MIGRMQIRISDVCPRGMMIVHWRDWEDAFTFRPTRTDFETGKMLEAADVLDDWCRLSARVTANDLWNPPGDGSDT